MPSVHAQLEVDRDIEILKLNGIDCNHQRQRKEKQKYRFLISHFNVLTVFQLSFSRPQHQPLIYSRQPKKSRWKQINTKSVSKDIIKSKNLAIRALYVLGYDTGMVEMNVFRSKPKYVVARVMTEHDLSRSLKDILHNKSAKMKQKDQGSKKESLLGTDVEFVLRHVSGKYIVASRYLPKRGKAGYDAIWLRGKRDKFPLAELRPNPSTNPHQLFDHLYECMQLAVQKIKNPRIEWLAGGQPLKQYPIGGHIHFSQVPLTPKLIRALDNYLTLPLFLMESEESRSRRPKYGYIGDFRKQFHRGFEYRTPPSWIVSPSIAKGVLMLAKVIATDYEQLSSVPLNQYDIQRAFYLGNRHVIYPVVRKLWIELSQTPTYQKYENELQRFYELIEQGYTWDEYQDIRPAWSLPPFQR